MVEAFTSIYTDLEVVGRKSKLHVFDNDCSCSVQNFLKIKKTKRQNMEADHNNTNAAGPAVKSTKYHIISNIATMGAICPIKL